MRGGEDEHRTSVRHFFRHPDIVAKCGARTAACFGGLSLKDLT